MRLAYASLVRWLPTREACLVVPTLLILLGLSGTLMGQGTVAYHSSTSATSSGAVSTLGFSFTVPAVSECFDPILVVPVGLMRDAGSVASVSGVTWNPGSSTALTLDPGTALSSDNNDSNRKRVEIWLLVAPAPGVSGTVTVTMPGGASNTAQIVAGAVLACGVDQTTPVIGSGASRHATGSTSAQTFAPSAVGALLVDVVSVDGNIGLTIGNSEIVSWDANTGTAATNLRSGSGHKNSTVPFEVPTWALGASHQWVIGGLTLNPRTPSDIGLTTFEASGFDRGVALRWHTGYEVENLGYRLHRQVGKDRLLVNRGLIVGSGLSYGGVKLESGNAYAWWDAEGHVGDVYWLEDVEVGGPSQWHGPFVATHGFGEPPPIGQSQLLSEVLRSAGGTRLAVSEQAEGALGFGSRQFPTAKAASSVLVDPRSLGDGPLAIQWQLARTRTAKIRIDRAGWYRLRFDELAAVGFNVRNAEGLRLFRNGVEQAFLMRQDVLERPVALEFLGVPDDTLASGEAVYWLSQSKRPGARVPTRVNPWIGSGKVETVPFSLEVRERLVYLFGLLNGDAENFFGQPVTSSPAIHQLSIDRLGDEAQVPSRVEVVLQGLTEDAYDIEVSANGTSVGTLSLDGTGRYVAGFDIPAGLLFDGDNTLELSRVGDSGVAIVDRIVLTHGRTTSAGTGQVALTFPEGRPPGRVRLDGFSNSDIRVLDITRQDRPQEVAIRVLTGEGGWTADISLPRLSQDRVLLAFTDDQAMSPKSVTLNSPSSWNRSRHAAGMVIITPTEFFEPARTLKAFHESSGLTTELVSIEDVFDEYSYGSKDPSAIRSFLDRAHNRWREAPRFVLLLGDGSYDYRDYLGFGDDRIPTRLVDTERFEAASDDWFADFNGDAVPEMAVGRLPVRTLEEANVVVSKILDHQSTTDGVSTALLVADSAVGENFAAINDRFEGRIPQGITIDRIDIDDLGTSDGRVAILDALRDGVDLVSYSGHGSLDRWTGGMLTVDDSGTLANGERLPIFTMMNCLNGLFNEPLLSGLGEVLVREANGGAAAVWASSAITTAGAQEVLFNAFFEHLFESPGTTLGEAAMAAKAAVDDVDIRQSWILLGDPAMVVERAQP